MSIANLLKELKETLASADRAQKCHSDGHADQSLYYINGVQDRVKFILGQIKASGIE